jgi:hypothetical protein
MIGIESRASFRAIAFENWARNKGYAQLNGKGTYSAYHPEAGTGQEEPF